MSPDYAATLNKIIRERRRPIKLTSFLYRIARVSRDAEVIASGNPKKMARRAKNKMLGRTIVRRLFKW